MQNLLGVSRTLDDIIHDFAALAVHYKDAHPANAGDVSQVLPVEVGEEIASRFCATSSSWFRFEDLPKLATLRRDGRTGFRTEGVHDERFFAASRYLAGRRMLITRTGSQLPALQHTIDRDEDGKLLNIIEISSDGRSLRVIYGNHEYGSIPSIETHVHVYANALNVAEGWPAPATVHAHPYSLVSLGRHPKIRGSFQHFNAAIYTAVEGLNRNYDGLVAVVPYEQSGSAALLSESIDALRDHRLVLWMNHGFVVREENIRRAYTLLGYAEWCAQAALDSLEGAMNLPEKEIRAFLEAHDLMTAHDELFTH